MTVIEDNTFATFEAMELDPRLTRALQRNNIINPTLIQEKAIPLALEGKDILAKARTGSGKTLSYLLPILHHLLTINNNILLSQNPTPILSRISCLVMVPTKELARQITVVLRDLLYYAPSHGPGHISILNLAHSSSSVGSESEGASLTLQRSQLQAHPTIVISTPSKLLLHLPSEPNLLRELQFLVIDEADLMLSFGYGEDMTRLARDYLPTTMQSFLMSATLNADVETLKQLILRNPVILKLEEGDGHDGEGAPRLKQYSITVSKDEEKFLLMYVILKLKLLPGKLLIFANDVDRCYRLKLFLEQFGIRSCILNGELPITSRLHIVDEFNRGIYDLIIASDSAIQIRNNRGQFNKETRQAAKKNGISLDKESGVARGIDFKKVDVVINFDLPSNQAAYVHRVGRTARGKDLGMALSLVIESDSEARALLNSLSDPITPYEFDQSQLDGFRYRCTDALRAVSTATIRSARLKVIRQELVKSERLKTFWEERPRDLQLLKHDTSSSGLLPVKPHLKHVPDYLFSFAKEKLSEKLDETTDEKIIETDKGDNTTSSELKMIFRPPLTQPSNSTVSSKHDKGTKRRRFPFKKRHQDPLKKIKK